MTYVAPDVAEPPRPPPKRRRWIGTPGVVWYRDQAIRRILFQIIFLVLVAAGIYLAFSNLVNNLGESNIVIDFGVFKRPFGTSVAEGPRIDTPWDWTSDANTLTSPYWILWAIGWAYFVIRSARQYLGTRDQNTGIAILVVGLGLLAIQPFLLDWLFKELTPYLIPRTNTRVLYTGFINTVRVVAASVVASTLLGILMGIGLLSRNFLLRNISKAYVEVFRNTPLYVQLLFVYTTLLILLPDSIPEAIQSPEKISIPVLGTYHFHEMLYSINSVGLSFAVPVGTSTVPIFWGAIALGAVISWFVRRWRLQQQDLTGIPANTWQFIIPIMVAFTLGGWLLAEGYPIGDGPFRMNYLSASRFKVEGGYTVTLFFFAIFLGLTLYTASFIADIVRAGIQAVSYGQVEAARAHGLSNAQVLTLVVLPQALRLIIPPLGNQYVNMGKNSSLAIAVGFMDLYLLANVVNNESGQAVPIFMGLLVIYLFLSLMLSLLTNLMNSFSQLRTR